MTLDPVTLDPLPIDAAALRYDASGLLPVVVQDAATGAVLMLAYADREAVERMLASGEAHFWSRSRQAPWRKGETSGHVLEVAELLADCDGDALLVRAHPRGPTCHRGTVSCFEPNAAALELGWLERVIAERLSELRASGDPGESYTARLLSSGLPRAAQKVGEEAVETLIAALAPAAPESEERVTAEAADLLYHLLVLLAARGVPARAVAEELARRHREHSSGERRSGEQGTAGDAPTGGGGEG